MKVVKLKPKQTNDSHPELVSGPPSNCNDVADSRQIPDQVRDDDDDWQYQGKRRDQVESSGEIFAFCLMAFFVAILLALLFH